VEATHVVHKKWMQDPRLSLLKEHVINPSELNIQAELGELAVQAI
jgi:hypothetical protein